MRTSPDHGTAYEIAGKNEANPSSFRQAVYTAIDIVRIRTAYDDMHADVMKKRDKPKDAGGDDGVVVEK